MGASPNKGEQLLRAAQGEEAAVTELLGSYGNRLRKIATSRVDARLVARIDPSDVVQETLVVAAGNLPRYTREQPMAFNPWLRRLTLQRLVDLQRRSVLREECLAPMNDSTVHELARDLWAQTPGPHSEAVVAEREANLRRAVDSLEETQRDVLLLHYVEDLSLTEAAQVFEITADTARMRHLRPLTKLCELLDKRL